MSRSKVPLSGDVFARVSEREQGVPVDQGSQANNKNSSTLQHHFDICKNHAADGVTVVTDPSGLVVADMVNYQGAVGAILFFIAAVQLWRETGMTLYSFAVLNRALEGMAKSKPSSGNGTEAILSEIGSTVFAHCLI